MGDSIFNILNFSDEILTKILLNLNARERISLGKSCTRFYRLIFEDKILVRDLDFSEEGYLTSLSDVQQYFKDDTLCRHIRRIDLANMYCSKPESMLQDMKKATHLVELNIICIRFCDLAQLGSFLGSLKNLKKLSVAWPAFADLTEGVFLKKSFKKLESLTVRVDDLELLGTFLPVVSRYSRKLEVLCLIVAHLGVSTFGRTYMNETLEALKLTQLPKLKVVAGYNLNYLFVPFHDIVEQILPDRERWTEIHVNSCGSLYYEKDLKVAEEMKSHIHDWPAGVEYIRPIKFLEPGYLLADMVQNATGVTAKDFQCSRRHDNSVHPVTLKVKDVKDGKTFNMFQLLLENPSHRISYINVESDLEKTSVAYLSAFPYLKNLVLRGIIKASSTLLDPTDVEGESRYFEEPSEAVISNPDFHKLVKNTPHLKDFTLCPRALRDRGSKTEDDPWDLTALHLISGWTELTSLFLENIPIVNGEFLIEIGKRCKNLETLRLQDLGTRDIYCYKNELSQMLTHCHNLKDFSIDQTNLGQVSDVFTVFVKNLKLQRLSIRSPGGKNCFDNLMSSIETLMLFHKIIFLKCDFETLDKADYDNLKSNLQRMKDESDRKAFEFEIINCWNSYGFSLPSQNNDLEYAHKDVSLSYSLTNGLYQLGC